MIASLFDPIVQSDSKPKKIYSVIPFVTVFTFSIISKREFEIPTFVPTEMKFFR
jgi:hypothetical protein